MMETIRKVAFCPHCGNRSPQRLIHTQHSSDVGWSLEDGTEWDHVVVHFVVVCETCSKVLVYETFELEESSHFNITGLVYPDSGKLHYSVPQSVSDIYNEAVRIKNIAPNAFAVQIRRALEALCENRGAQKRTLQDQLKELVEKGEIPKTLVEVTDLLRFIGNAGAHASGSPVKPWHVHTIDEFFRAVIEYVYVAPSKVEEFKNSFNELKSKSSGGFDENGIPVF